MPLLGDPGHAAITKSLKTKVPKILKLGTPDAPKAIVLVTAHWSTNKVTISSGSKHGLLYDYYGFPPESYEIKHDAPGSPEVAEEVAKALKEAGVECQKDPERGMFKPLLNIFKPVSLTTNIRMGPWRLRPHEAHRSLRENPHRPSLRPRFRIRITVLRHRTCSKLPA